MDDLPDDSENVDIIKKATKDVFQQKFKEIEAQTGRLPPNEFVTLVDSIIEDMSPSTMPDTVQFLREFPGIFKGY